MLPALTEMFHKQDLISDRASFEELDATGRVTTPGVVALWPLRSLSLDAAVLAETLPTVVSLN